MNVTQKTYNDLTYTNNQSFILKMIPADKSQ
jgi:hypothetical protein